MNTKTKISRNRAFNIFLYIFFFLMCACFVLPLIVVISASFTSEQALTSGGFSLLPRDFTLDAQPGRSAGGVSPFPEQFPLPQAHHGLYLLYHALQRRYDSELHYLRQVL